MDTVSIPILQISKLRLEEVELLAQGHIDAKGWNWDSRPGLPDIPELGGHTMDFTISL